VPGLGSDLTTSEFVANQSDSELVAFIKEGRAPDHPENVTGVAMPPKGGNPSLTDEDLSHIVAYIRSIHQ
jgi:disulfide bond formation protein DsbB